MVLERKTKQIIIASVWGLLFLTVAYLIYLGVRPDPTCFDGKRNGGEEGIDCGGVCPTLCEIPIEANDLVISENVIVSAGQGLYDALITVENPNALYGASEFAYTADFYRADGELIRQESGFEYILPAQRKYIIISEDFSDVTASNPAAGPARMEVTISDVVWTEFRSYEAPQIPVLNKQFNFISDGPGYAEAKGLVRNDSGFDFNRITVSVVLRDIDGQVVALHKNEMNTVVADEERDFRLIWPNRFEGEVFERGIEMRADADIFDNDNFIERHAPGQFFDDDRDSRSVNRDFF